MLNNLDDIKNKIIKAIENKQIRKIRELIEGHPIADIADIIEKLPLESILLIMRVLPRDTASELFSYFEWENQIKLAKSFTEPWGMRILQDLETDELADIIDEMPSIMAKAILTQTSPEKRELINSILSFNEDQVGSIMNVDIASIKDTWNVKKAIARIRRRYRENIDITHDIYVINENGKLVGSTTFEDIVFSNDNTLISDICEPVRSVLATDDTEKASVIFSEHDRNTLPVVFADNRLAGIITADDIIDVIQEEATEDMYKMAGINAEDAEENYLKRTVKSIVKSRIFWLIILMISATFSQYIIQQFTNISESALSNFGLAATLNVGIIVGLIPIISGSAGNAGSQSTTTITRAVAMNEISHKNLRKVVWKEFLVGFIVGAIMFAINIVRLVIYFAIFRPDINPYNHENIIRLIWALTLVILGSSLALWIVVINAKIMGSVIPLIALKIKKDPAVMSAPILTTLTDAISTLIFFGLNIGILAIGHIVGII